MVVIPERATRPDADPDDRSDRHHTGRSDAAFIARDYVRWILHTMAETMPVAMSRVRDWYSATSQANQSMMLVAGAQRLETFVELANATAEASGVPDRFLELEYFPDKPQRA